MRNSPSVLRRVALLLFLWIAVSVAAHAGGEPPRSKLSGYALFDLFYNADHPDDAKRGIYGSTIRRLYFTYDFAVKPRYKARVRFEANDGTLMLLPKAVRGAAATGDPADLDPDASKPGIIVKDAYLEWAIDAAWTRSFRPTLLFGIQSTPAFGELEERAWKYRSLEKTLLDLRKIASSRDLGFGIRGALGESGVTYRFLVGNDTTKAETNAEKRYYGVIAYAKRHLLGEVDGHVRERAEGRAEIVAKGFVGVRGENAAVHATLVGRWTDDPHAGDTARRRALGASLFGRYRLRRGIEFVARVDRFDPDTAVEKDASFLVILALAYRPSPYVDFIPNVWIEQPEDSKVGRTVRPRLTVHYRF